MGAAVFRSAGRLVRIQQAQTWRPWSSPELSKALAEVVGERAVDDPDRAAYLANDARVSWAQYHALSQRLACLLLSVGLERGERIAVLLPDGPGIHIAYLGAEKAGLVTVGIGARAGFRELEHALQLTGASGIISLRSTRAGACRTSCVISASRASQFTTTWWSRASSVGTTPSS